MTREGSLGEKHCCLECKGGKLWNASLSLVDSTTRTVIFLFLWNATQHSTAQHSGIYGVQSSAKESCICVYGFVHWIDGSVDGCLGLKNQSIHMASY